MLLKFGAVLSVICGFLMAIYTWTHLLQCIVFALSLLRMLKLRKLAVRKLYLLRGGLTLYHGVLKPLTDTLLLTDRFVWGKNKNKTKKKHRPKLLFIKVYGISITFTLLPPADHPYHPSGQHCQRNVFLVMGYNRSYTFIGKCVCIRARGRGLH